MNKTAEQRRANETLDSVKFDGDIDLDREKTREQLGFKDNPAKPLTAADIFKAAREKAAHVNAMTADDIAKIDLSNALDTVSPED